MTRFSRHGSLISEIEKLDHLIFHHLSFTIVCSPVWVDTTFLFVSFFLTSYFLIMSKPHDLSISTLHQRQPSPLPQVFQISLDSPPLPGYHHLPRINTPPITPNRFTFTQHSPLPIIVKTPLPFLKILPLLIARCSEGLIYSVILPYINEMIHSFGVPEKSVGVWSATAVSFI